MIDVYSETWAEIKQFVESLKTDLMPSLMNPAMSFEQTQYIRGKLIILDEIIRLPSAKKLPKIETHR